MTATYTQFQLNAPITQANFAAALTSVVEGLGGAIYDSWLNNFQYLVFKFSEDSNTKGTVYLYFAVNYNGTTVTLGIYDGWSIANHSGTNGSGQITFAVTTTAVFTFNIINHLELKGFFINQTGNGNNGAFIGFLRPANMPS